jgi:tetratricopeptide (TPR) repeat protein
MSKMEQSEVEFFPKDSIEFWRNVEPIYVLSEELCDTNWIGSEPLIITYSSDTKYYGDAEDFQNKLNKQWEERIRNFNRKSSSNLKVIVKPDLEVRMHELKTSSFLIYSMLPCFVFSKIIEGLDPIIKIEGKKIIVGENSYEGDYLQISVTIPNLFNPRRFFAFIIGTSLFYSGMYIAGLGEYNIHRPDGEIIEKGSLEFDEHGKAIGFKNRKEYRQDNNWLCTLSNHFIICVRPGSLAQKEIKHLIRLHESAYKDIATTLGIKSNNDKFLWYVHHRYKGIEIKRGYYEPCSRIIHTVYNEEVREIYLGIHELVHAITDKYWGRNELCLWSEGTSTFLDKNKKSIRPIEFYTAELLYSNALVPLKDLLNNSTFKKYANVDVYNQAASFVKFLVERYGWRRFGDMVKKCSKKPSKVLELFECVYNTALTEIEKEWKSYISEYLKKHKNEIEDWRPLWSAQRNMFYKNYPVALSDIEVSLKKNDKDPYVFYLAGKCHFSIGNLEVAHNNFLKAVSFPIIREEDGSVCRHSNLYLGKIHDLMGKREMAISYYNQVLGCPEYDDAHDDARKLLETPYKHEVKESYI